MKAVLEISGFDVDTATSAHEGRSKIRTREYQMVITDMRMESDAAGREVIQAARTAHYHPAVALLTAFPVEQDDWMEMGADRMLVKPMQAPRAGEGKASAKKAAGKKPVTKRPAKKTAAKKVVARKKG
jgi:DNA-binding response OmpR family regulator